MGKKHSFLGFLTFLFLAIFGANAFADGYVCPDAMVYHKCNPGYHLATNASTGNADCFLCAAGTSCPGGVEPATVCPTTTDNGAIPTYSSAGASECTQCSPDYEIFGDLTPVAYEYEAFVDGKYIVVKNKLILNPDFRPRVSPLFFP